MVVKVNPYDGFDIGSFIGDAIRNIVGWSGVNYGRFNKTHFTGALLGHGGASGYADPTILTSDLADQFDFNASRVVPTSYENRPGSLSDFRCISY